MKSADKTTKRTKRKRKVEANEDLRESACLRDARVAMVDRNVSPNRSVAFSNTVKVSGTKSRQLR